MEPTSSEYLQRCLETLQADINCSDETKVVMFNEYARLLNLENREADIIEIVDTLSLASTELDSLLKRLGYKNGSDGLDKVNALLEKHIATLPPIPEEELPPPAFVPEPPLPPTANIEKGNGKMRK